MYGGGVVRRGACRVWWGVGRTDVKGPLGRPKNRWKHNIQVNLSQDRYRWRTVLNAVLNLWVSENAGDFLTS
jgi:hypothetical protein